MKKILAIVSFLFAINLHADTNAITVSGSGQSAATPDIAAVTIGITSRDPTPKNVLTAISQSTNDLTKLATSFGVEPKDIQTSQFNLNQDYEVTSRKGFVGVATYIVTLRDMKRVGDFISSAVESGANTIQGVQFTIGDTTELYRKARERAFNDARQKAEQLAALSKVALGPVISIDEGGNEFRPRPMFRMAALEASAPAVAGGEVSQGVTLTVRFAIGR